ncbi:unnamed protein product [Adineta steineri]|uniref:Uncharacterized protein n=1 Tax=Adineta steineri TaxID=433720 RepID=A0A813ZRD6_9BILA|nr:unnamed protein product [Adineta steineri]CAF3833727.1 unnamed protein product [Adineta steineri]
MPGLNGSAKANGKVSPMDEETAKRLSKAEIDNTLLMVPNDPVEPTQEVAKKGFLYRLFKKESKKKEPPAPKKPEGPKLKTFEIYKYADKLDILLMVLGTFAALATGAAMPIMMWLFQSVINGLVTIGKGNSTTSANCEVAAGSTGDPYATIEGIIKWYATLGGSSIVMYWIAYALWMIASERQLRRIRYALFQSIMSQEMGWFDCRNAGELSSRLVDDLENIREGTGFKVADFICLLSRIIGTLVFSFYEGWKLTLVFLSVSPLIILSFNILIKIMIKYTVMELQAYSTANSIAQEVLGAIRTVTAFGGQSKESNRYESNLTKGRSVGIKKGALLGLAQALVNVILYGGIAIVFWYGPYLIRTECDHYSAGQFMVIFISCLTSTFSLANLIPNIQSFAEASGSGAYVFQVIERQSKINIFSDEGETPPDFTGDIEFKNVQFTYPARKDAPILNNLNMKIPSGKTVALCGSSGCGKSTSIQLIQRFYDPDGGEVLLDGRDLRSISLKWLRSNIGIVSQEPVLFFGTIEENIRFGKPDATDDEVMNAAKMANAHDFIMQLPQNYKTSSGDKLSGGQKQRVAIARALISNPKLLLLDEATSALDNQGEKVVQDALDKAKEGRTTIVIAHRLSTIKNADIIVGLDRGQVVECGTHDELMQNKGLYYELVTAQSEKEKEKELENENDPEDELEEELAKQAIAPTKPKSRRLSRQISTALRRASIVSAKSVTSETSESGNDANLIKDEEKQSGFRMPIIFQVMRLNAPEWFYLVIGGIASLGYGAVTPAFSLIFSSIFGALAETDEQKQTDEIRMYTYILFLIGVAGGIFQFLSSVTLAKAGEELTMRMRIMSFRSMLRQEIGWFDVDENNLGALVTRLSSDAASLKGFTGPTFGAILNAVGAVVTALIISFIAGWKLTLVILCFTPLMIFTGIIQGQQMSKASGNKSSASNDAEDGGKQATQAIENIRTVVSLHQEERFIRLYKKAFDSDFRRRMLTLHYVAFANALANSLMFFIHATAFGYGITLIKSGDMQFADVFRVFTVVTFAAMSIGRSASMVPNYSKGKASASRIFDLNKRQSKIDPDDPSGIKLSSISGNIEFRDVRFRYPARPKLRILRHFNLVCTEGETTALVGPSGSGKSTSVALIQRFYDPLGGTVLLDGHDVKTLNIQWLRSLLGLVQQEPVLFNLSVRDNIAYGDNTREATQDDIEAAAKKANIHELIASLPEGYNTSCGAKGGQLSGGQKQRIAIARALIRNPKILLLDEATSALDNKSEKVVQDALDQARTGRSCLTIAHRLPTIRNSDKICVVDRGQIKESGRHEQLLQEHGIYHKLYMAQERPENQKET